MSRPFVVVYEAPDDATLACCLADRILLDEVDWLEPGLLDSQRQWLLSVVAEGKTVELRWANIRTLARQLNVNLFGTFDGEAAEPDAKAARRAIIVIKRLIPTTVAILLTRDSDKQLSRRKGLVQAQQAEKHVPVVIGLAVPEREAWVLAGFDPIDEAETKRLQAERQRCGFDPRLKSQNLMATGDDRADKSAKRVLAALVGDSREREACCWRDTLLEKLKSRGSENGLAEYLNGVSVELTPLLSGRKQSPEKPIR